MPTRAPTLRPLRPPHPRARMVAAAVLAVTLVVLVVAATGARAEPPRAPHPAAAPSVATLTLALSAELSMQPSVAKFPTVSGSNLSGRRFTLPGGFEGQVNLVLLAFDRDQQSLVDTWIPTARRLVAAEPTVRFYELPTITRAFVVMSPVIAGGMRGGIPDPDLRDATITLYVDQSEFRRALDLPTDESIYALLVDREGNVLWREDGPFTERKGDALSAAVARHASASAR